MRSTHLALIFAATLAAASFTSTAQAGVCNSIGRFFGWGWSEGYHAYDNCPRNFPCNGPRIAVPCPSCQPAPPPYFSPATPPTHGPHAGRLMHPVPYPPARPQYSPHSPGPGMVPRGFYAPSPRAGNVSEAGARSEIIRLPAAE